MNKSDQINELASALAKAQGAIKGAIKDTANPFFKSKYADLSSVWDACRDQLAANGLAVIQTPCQSDSGGIGIETMLAHSSGQWVSSQYSMPVAKLDAQGVGSAITYARRYALAAMVGVAPEDDDGNSATGKPAPEVKTLSPDKLKGFAARIKAEITKEGAKNVWKESVKACAEIGDQESAGVLKNLLIQHGAFIDQATKETA